MTDNRDRKLRNSTEVNLSPQQKYILSLEEELGRRERELDEARNRINYLENELFGQSMGYFLDEFGRRIGSRFKLRNLEGIASKERTESFLDRVTNAIFFVYVIYAFTTAFLTKPKKDYKTRKEY